MGRDNPAQYWWLVEQLMLLGWYRAGQDPNRNPGRRSWGFREGHVTDTPGVTELWIEATTEEAAMRILLDELTQHRGSRNSPR